MRHIMLDLETMGTRPGSAIVAIGAVEFSIYKTGDTFEASIALTSSVAAGLRIDPATVVWWLRQSEKARTEVTSASETLVEALRRFSDWIGDGQVCIWGDGAAFDNVLLASAYTACRLPIPWKYVNDRCYRTMKELFPVERILSDKPHSALADAVSQANQMRAILAKYSIRLE